MMLPAQSKWSSAASSGTAKRSHFYDIFHPIYRRRSITLLTCAALDTIAGTAVNGWLYFQAVSILGLSPVAASTLVVTGMGVGMIGFPLGAWTSERFGRVPTVVYVGGAAWLGAFAFYLRSARVRAVAVHVAGRRVLLVQSRVRRDDGRRELRGDRTFPRRAAHHDDRLAGHNRGGVLDARAGADRRVDRTARRTRAASFATSRCSAFRAR